MLQSCVSGSIVRQSWLEVRGLPAPQPKDVQDMSALPVSTFVACYVKNLLAFHVPQVITVLRKMLAAEMRAKSSNNAELNPQKSASPSA